MEDFLQFIFYLVVGVIWFVSLFRQKKPRLPKREEPPEPQEFPEARSEEELKELLRKIGIPIPETGQEFPEEEPIPEIKPPPEELPPPIEVTPGQPEPLPEQVPPVHPATKIGGSATPYGGEPALASQLSSETAPEVETTRESLNLETPSTVRQAVILSTILGPPRSKLRPRF